MSFNFWLVTQRTNVLFNTLDGPGSIERQGCTDAPLLAIANDETTPLAFVHVVTQEETQNIESSEIKIGMSPKYESETSEEELQLNDEESADEVKVDDEESSDDEFEF